MGKYSPPMVSESPASEKIFISNDIYYPGNSFYKNLQMIINNLFIS